MNKTKLLYLLAIFTTLFHPLAVWGSPDCEYSKYSPYGCLYAHSYWQAHMWVTGIVFLLPFIFFVYLYKKRGKTLWQHTILFIIIYAFILWQWWKFFLATSRILSV